jgi:hypothetical protein
MLKMNLMEKKSIFNFLFIDIYLYIIDLFYLQKMIKVMSLIIYNPWMERPINKQVLYGWGVL